MSTSQQVIVITDKYNEEKLTIERNFESDKKSGLKIIRAALELFIKRCADNNNDAIFNKPSIAGYRQRVENEVMAFLTSDENHTDIKGVIYDCQERSEHGVEIHLERMTTHKPAYL